MDKRRLGTVEDSEEHCRGEKMRGDTRGEPRRDKDIKPERTYEMRVEEKKGQWRQPQNEKSEKGWKRQD